MQAAAPGAAAASPPGQQGPCTVGSGRLAAHLPPVACRTATCIKQGRAVQREALGSRGEKLAGTAGQGTTGKPPSRHYGHPAFAAGHIGIKQPWRSNLPTKPAMCRPNVLPRQHSRHIRNLPCLACTAHPEFNTRRSLLKCGTCCMSVGSTCTGATVTGEAGSLEHRAAAAAAVQAEHAAGSSRRPAQVNSSTHTPPPPLRLPTTKASAPHAHPHSVQRINPPGLAAVLPSSPAQHTHVCPARVPGRWAGWVRGLAR